MGRDACPVTTLPAPAIEDYVVARIIEATVDGALVAGARAALESHMKRRERLVTRLAGLAGKIAALSANVTRYVEAHHLQSAIDRGLVQDRATAAKRLGLTRARVTQLLDLLLLAPDLQDQVLHLEAVDGVEPLSMWVLRAVAHAGTWAEQRAMKGLLLH